METSFFLKPNEYFLGSLFQTVEHRAIVANDDVHDSSGTKLLASGQPLTAELREPLQTRTLRRAIERCLEVQDGIAPAELVACLRRRMDESPSLVALAGPHRKTLIELFEELRLAAPAQLQLAVLAQRDRNHLCHATTCAAIAACIALQLNLPAGAIEGAIISGLLHDIGENYLAPGPADHPDLPFEEWKRIAAHPRIGALLIGEFARYPSYVADAVHEHHERLDCSGYPAGKPAPAISELGQILMAAEPLTAILTGRDNPEARALLAMRLVPGQFSPRIVALLTSIFDKRAASPPETFSLDPMAPLAQLIADKLERCRQEAETLCSNRSLPGGARKLAFQSVAQCTRLLWSLHSTGIVSLLKATPDEVSADATLALELKVVIAELKWRMRALSRHIELVLQGMPAQRAAFARLIHELHVRAPSEAGAATSAPPHDAAALERVAA